MFFAQYKNEIRRSIFSSAFIVVISIIFLVLSIAHPILFRWNNTRNINRRYGGYYYSGMGVDTISIDGISIGYDNPFYWEISSLTEEITRITTSGDYADLSSSAKELMIKYLNLELDYYREAAKVATDYMDFRVQIAYSGSNFLNKVFYYEHFSDPDIEAVAKQRLPIDLAQTAKMTEEERMEELAELSGALEDCRKIFTSDTNAAFGSYIKVRRYIEQVSIRDWNKEIDRLAEELIKNPGRSVEIESQINGMRTSIEVAETVNLPEISYREANKIIPNDGSWQNAALESMVQNQQSFTYTVPAKEAEYLSSPYMMENFDSYSAYLRSIERQRSGFHELVLIAKASLDAGTPDMSFDRMGSRAVSFGYASGWIGFAIIFSVMVGSWSVANEFQAGTIRLLLVRPKTRNKILAAKYLSALSTAIGIFLASCIVNMLVSGIVFGFADFGNPNFTVTGPASFFSKYFALLAANLAILAMFFNVSFFLSTATKNIAASIVVPIVGYIGGNILNAYFAYRTINATLKSLMPYMPFMYFNFTGFFETSPYSAIGQMVSRGIEVSLAKGVTVHLAIAAVALGLSFLIFNKQDITS
ncbi:MAG: ABC transporter permease [Eubacteriaceae bacterium]|nr:ABC transporter permease [Eubacteriaceae bacterium]